MKFSASRILCIDDDANAANWIRIVLRGAKINAAVTTVKTGREAFTLLNRDNFDLCILEYALPDMTGVQLCSLMRQMGSDVPMIFFTAMSRPVDREKAMAAGASDYLCKPDDLDSFAGVIARFLESRQPVYAESTLLIDLPKAA